MYKRQFNPLDGVKEVHADFNTQEVVVTSVQDIKEEDVKAAIEKAGYTYKGRKEDKKMTKTVKVEGMMCQNCERHVKEALEAIDGVESAVSNKDTNTAEIELSKEVSAEVIEKAVTDAGYTFKGLE